MLMVTLRSLGGASYLDVSWPHGIEMSTVITIFQETIDVLNSKLCNKKLPTTEEEFWKESENFEK